MVMNTVEKKVSKINDTLFNKVTFSKNINIRERNGNWYLDGWVYYNSKSERVYKSTLKKSTKSEKRYIEKNKETILWELSNTKRDLEIERKGIKELLRGIATKIIHSINRYIHSLQRKRRVS